MQNERKTIAVFFEVNADTSTEAFAKWLDTCPFSHKAAVDFDYGKKPVQATLQPSGAFSRLGDDIPAGAGAAIPTATVTDMEDGNSEGDVSEVNVSESELSSENEKTAENNIGDALEDGGPDAVK